MYLILDEKYRYCQIDLCLTTLYTDCLSTNVHVEHPILRTGKNAHLFLTTFTQDQSFFGNTQSFKTSNSYVIVINELPKIDLSGLFWGLE